MANKKITDSMPSPRWRQLMLPVVDVSADTTNKITTTNLFRTLPDGTAAAPSLSFASDAANESSLPEQILSASPQVERSVLLLMAAVMSRFLVI